MSTQPDETTTPPDCAEVRVALNLILSAAADQGHTLGCITDALEYHLEYARRAQQVMTALEAYEREEVSVEFTPDSIAVYDPKP